MLRNCVNRIKPNNEKKRILRKSTHQQATSGSGVCEFEVTALVAICDRLVDGSSVGRTLIGLLRRRNEALQTINQQLDDQRSHDALTGLGNRRCLMQHQQQLWLASNERAKLGNDRPCC